jgi:branched-chain amino acid aminotransferase
VVERSVPREMLYIADEVFFVGTATEVTPIRSVDRHTVGGGRRGEITGRIQAEYMALIQGQKPDRHGWLTHVPALAAAATSRSRG